MKNSYVNQIGVCRPCLTAALLLVVACSSAAAADHPDPGELIALLESDAPGAEKAIACKQLAVFGDQEAVPALASLLSDERLSSWARIALEAIPGDEADEALRQSMETLDGRLLVGVVNSIGVRRDGAAVEGLAARLNDQDDAVASAAGVALGRIGNQQAIAALREALSGGPSSEGVRSAIAEGCVLCAERLMAEGRSAEAAEIYDDVRQADVPRPRVLEATRGAILARGPDGVGLLIEQLSSSDQDFFYVGLGAARELPGPDVTETLAEQLAQLPPQRGALLVFALADRGDSAALPVIMRSTQHDAKAVRLAALRVLQNQGDHSSLAILLRIAAEEDSELAQAAKDALAELPDPAVDADIASRLSGADVETLPLLIEIIGRRRINATPALLEAADHADSSVRRAALTALGETVKLENLDVLIQRVAQPADPQEASVARRALKAAAVRMPDRAACAEQLAAAIATSSTAANVAMLETLGAMGGATALQTLGDVAENGDEQLQDVASRMLGEWMTVDAAPQLLAIAKAPDNKFSVRALRGYIRLARQFDMSPSQRAEMCQAALDAAQREAEKTLVLQVLQRYPSKETLEVAVAAATDQEISSEAKQAAQQIEQSLKD